MIYVKKNIVKIIGAFVIPISIFLGMVEVLYGRNYMQADYGVFNVSIPSIASILWRFSSLAIVPIVFILGILTYIEKNNSSNMKKFITILIALVIIVWLCVGIDLAIQYFTLD